MASMAFNIAHGTPAYVTLYASFLRSIGPGRSGQSYNSRFANICYSKRSATIGSSRAAREAG
jgi:hypothetical protein